MSFLAALLHHAIYVCLLGFLLTLITLPHIGAQQPPLPPGPDPNPSPSQWMIWVVITLTVLFTTIYSIFLAHCSPAVAADGRGFSWPVLAGRTMMARGLDAAVIDTFPMLVYADIKGMKLRKGALERVVCLSEFKDHETLHLILKCDHMFHPNCIDEWFAFHSTCPVCRAELAPQSSESPRAIIPIVGMMQATEPSIQVGRKP